MPFKVLLIDRGNSAIIEIRGPDDVWRQREFRPQELDHLVSIYTLENPDLIVFDRIDAEVSAVDFMRRLAVLRRSKIAPIVLVGSLEFVYKSGSDPETLPDVAFLLGELLKFLKDEQKPNVLSGHGICLNPSTREVTRFGRRVSLDPTELRLLETLMEQRGQILRRQELAQRISDGEDNIDDRTVDVYIWRLRKALTRGSEISPIRTVRGLGYSFE